VISGQREEFFKCGTTVERLDTTIGQTSYVVSKFRNCTVTRVIHFSRRIMFAPSENVV
jgi:hypothetical protein